MEHLLYTEISTEIQKSKTHGGEIHSEGNHRKPTMSKTLKKRNKVFLAKSSQWEFLCVMPSSSPNSLFNFLCSAPCYALGSQNFLNHTTGILLTGAKLHFSVLVGLQDSSKGMALVTTVIGLERTSSVTARNPVLQHLYCE